MRIRFPWFTLYGESHGRRVRCFLSMLVHEAVELTFGTAVAHAMPGAVRYQIGVAPAPLSVGVFSPEAAPPITLVPPTPSLLTSASALPDGLFWRQGLSWTVGSCHPSATWQACPDVVEEDFPTKQDAVPLLVTGTSPFTYYTPIDCDWTRDDDLAVKALASLSTEIHAAWATARALWLGEGMQPTIMVRGVGIPTPTLRNSALDVTGGGLGGGGAAMDLDDAVAVLLNAYQYCTGGNGGAVFHVPEILIPGALGGIPGGGRICWPEGNLYRGPVGSVVSPGPGYPHGASTEGADGFGPIIPVSGDYQGNDVDECWVYVTGPLQFALGDIDAISPAPFSARQNRMSVIAERDAIIRFDPCCVFAAKVNSSAGPVS